MRAHTEVTFDKLSKRKIIGITLSLQNKVESISNGNNDNLEEKKNFLKKKFAKLESAINITKQVNTLLNKRVADIEEKMPSIKGGSASKLQALLVISPTRV